MNTNQGTQQTQTMVTTSSRRAINKQLTGSQLVMIMSLREELGMPKLTSHNISCMSIDAASRMIEDLVIFRDTLESLGAYSRKSQPEAQPQQQPQKAGSRK